MEILRFKMKVFEKGSEVQNYTTPPYKFSDGKQLADALHRFWITASRLPACRLEVDSETVEIHLPPRQEGYGPDTCVVIVNTIPDCVHCTKAAVWVAKCGPGAKIFFCDSHARKEKNFGKNDPNWFTWEQI